MPPSIAAAHDDMPAAFVAPSTAGGGTAEIRYSTDDTPSDFGDVSCNSNSSPLALTVEIPPHQTRSWHSGQIGMGRSTFGDSRAGDTLVSEAISFDSGDAASQSDARSSLSRSDVIPPTSSAALLSTFSTLALGVQLPPITVVDGGEAWTWYDAMSGDRSALKSSSVAANTARELQRQPHALPTTMISRSAPPPPPGLGRHPSLPEGSHFSASFIPAWDAGSENRYSEGASQSSSSVVRQQGSMNSAMDSLSGEQLVPSWQQQSHHAAMGARRYSENGGNLLSGFGDGGAYPHAATAPLPLPHQHGPYQKLHANYSDQQTTQQLLGAGNTVQHNADLPLPSFTQPHPAGGHHSTQGGIDS